MKLILTIFSYLIISCICINTLSAIPNKIVSVNSGNIYYIDNENGSDSNNGLSTATAWKTLDKVNSITFQAGDKILFKSGQEFRGNIQPLGNGTPQAPIVVGKYGGDTKPIINGQGKKATIYLRTQGGWEFEDLEITNDGGDNPDSNADKYRAGFLAEIYSGTTSKKHFVLRNLTIHHIYSTTPELKESGTMREALKYTGQGIHFNLYGDHNSYFEDILIENCHISYTASNGISLNNWTFDKVNIDSPSNRYNKNITIRNNTLEYIGGPGMVPMNCENLLVENNVVDHSGATEDDRQAGRGSGIWPLFCKNVLIQRNKFMHARGEGDSCGAHVDIGNRNTVLQYNFMYDNEGGFVEVMGRNEDVTYRYNVSVNDASRIKGQNKAFQHGAIVWFSDYNGGGNPRAGSNNIKIYNNTVYMKEGIKGYFEISEGNTNAYVKNNIFYVDGQTFYEKKGQGSVVNFDNNIYYGSAGNIAGFPYGENDKRNVDPMYINKGGTEADDYLLMASSPAVDTGVDIAEKGLFDYWGKDISEANLIANIGADESDSMFDIRYHNVRGTNNNPTQYLSTSSTITLSDLTDDNAVFLGWYTDASFTTPISEVPQGSKGHLDIYAKWEVINGFEKGKIKPSVYPNPATQYFSIDKKVKQIDLYNSSGKLIKSFTENLHKYNISDLIAGMYTLVVHTNYDLERLTVVVVND